MDLYMGRVGFPESHVIYVIYPRNPSGQSERSAIALRHVMCASPRHPGISPRFPEQDIFLDSRNNIFPNHWSATSSPPKYLPRQHDVSMTSSRHHPVSIRVPPSVKLQPTLQHFSHLGKTSPKHADPSPAQSHDAYPWTTPW